MLHGQPSPLVMALVPVPVQLQSIVMAMGPTWEGAYKGRLQCKLRMSK